jgi:hypothetical protein
MKFQNEVSLLMSKPPVLYKENLEQVAYIP